MSKWQTIKAKLLEHRTILYIYILVTLVASIHLYALGFSHEFGGRNYTEYNNYIIFKNSFFHLISGKDLYIYYPNEQWDLYKYSPSFALVMGALAYLPDIIGLCLWNLINALALYAAIRMLPLANKKISLLLWFILLELLTSLQSSQSNALLGALIIGAFALLERRKILWATLLLVAASFIKVYGAIGFVFFLFYPDKIKFILYSILWTVILFCVPLTVLNVHELVAQYQSWGRMMAADQAVSYGFSVMGWLHSWFGLDNIKNAAMLTGIVLFFIPLARFRQYSNPVYRIFFLAYTLIWVIIFNYKAESSTYIIAVSGIAIWYFTQPGATWKKVLLWLAFIFTCLSPTDLFPPPVRTQVMVPYVVKTVPCILVWCVLFYELLRVRHRQLTTPAL
jgi:hypothetical protein